MERRTFIERLLAGLALGGLLFAAGCAKSEDPPRFGNQESLWLLSMGQGKSDEPVAPSYSKATPALYRDASMGKADPSFVPKVSGG